jgi:hypothetical protein
MGRGKAAAEKNRMTTTVTDRRTRLTTFTFTDVK